MTNLIKLKGNRIATKGKQKQQYAIITDDDLLLVEGRLDEMLGRLQSKLGKTKEELQTLIHSI